MLFKKSFQYCLTCIFSISLLTISTSNIAQAETIIDNAQVTETTNNAVPTATKLHKVKAGETLYSISRLYNVSVADLQTWNFLGNSTIIEIGQFLGVNGSFDYFGILFNTREDFINTILPYAMSIAEEYNIYTSVLLAQAIVESNGGNSELAKISNNIFGIKALTSNYVEKPTWEVIDGKNVEILGKFEFFSSYNDAIQAYANKIRNGVTWDRERYKGAWVENTSSYLDATQALTGIYATDPQYANTLNNAITQYDLTKYDTHIVKEEKEIINTISVDEILSSKVVNYRATITGGSHTIDTQPWGVTGFRTIAQSSSYLGENYRVTEEKVTERATWAYLDGLGWIDKTGITPETITSSVETNYFANVISGNHSIDTLPWGIDGYRTVTYSSSYVGQRVKVIKEAVTPRSRWALIELDGKELGWMDLKGLKVSKDVVLSTKSTDYRATITGGSHTIDTQPWGVTGFQTVAQSSSYLGKNYPVTEEKVTGRATWAYLDGLGWIDKAGITPETITSRTAVNYRANIKVGKHSIDTLPWGVEGYKTINYSATYLGLNFEIVEEAITSRSTWAYIKDLGWIDKAALEPEKITSSKEVLYGATIIRESDSISTLPWGVYGYEIIAKSSEYYGENVLVIKEAVTPRAAWGLISYEGKELGWIDLKGLKINNDIVLSTKSTNYRATLTGGSHTIDTQPWGVAGFQTIAQSSSYLGKNYRVIEEKVTGRATWAYLERLGWIDKAGITPETITSAVDTNYFANVVSGNHSIDTLPWGVDGYKTVNYSSNYLGQRVKVIKEAVTPRSRWALIELDGKEIGWMDKKGLMNNTVFIDVGHGGSDPGAQYYGVNEKDINLTISLKLKNELEKQGFFVIMSRTSDVYLDFKTERSALANNSGADIFVSVHNNAMPGNTSVNGIETFYYEYDRNYQPVINQDMHNDPDRLLKSAALANAIHNNLITNTGAYDRGVRRETFAVLRETALPAALLELGFMSNVNELNNLLTESYQDKLVKSVSAGIAQYFKTY